MEPTVGRIVHYNTRGSADGIYPPTVFAAIITAIHPESDEMAVDLATFGPSGLRFDQGVIKGGEAGHWDWPPRVEPRPMG